MGIGNSRGDWWKTCQQAREEDQKRVKKGLAPKLHAERFENAGHVPTTPAFEAHAKKYRLYTDENGKHLVSTERGKRRNARKKKS